VSASDPDDRLYGFSNLGASLAAPGENSTTAAGGGYERFLGTSSAAPVVSGIAGLVLSAAPGAEVAAVERLSRRVPRRCRAYLRARALSHAELALLGVGERAGAGSSG
jgi:subtilisin family serine protease